MANRQVDKLMLWRLYPMMAERDIRNAKALQRELRLVGVEVSSQNLLRLMRENPRRVSSDIMFGLTEVLECTAADLWVNPNQVGARPLVPQSKKDRPPSGDKRAMPHEPSLVDLIGPKVAPYPVDDGDDDGE